MFTDPISDMLTQIRNALAVKKSEVIFPYSKFKHNLAEILEKQGWVASSEIVDPSLTEVKKKSFKLLKVQLKYDNIGFPTITGMKRVSKPGQRIYAKSNEIQRYRLGIGATIISTPRGLMTDREARKAKLGGEVVCQIW